MELIDRSSLDNFFVSRKSVGGRDLSPAFWISISRKFEQPQKKSSGSSKVALIGRLSLKNWKIEREKGERWDQFQGLHMVVKILIPIS